MMRNRVMGRGILIVLAIVLIAGCATTGTQAPTTLTPLQQAQQKSIYFMAAYKAQYDDAASMGALAQQGKLSLQQIQIYRIKRDLLIKAKPLIDAFDMIVGGGGIPAPGREQEINDLINRLVAAGS